MSRFFSMETRRKLSVAALNRWQREREERAERARRMIEGPPPPDPDEVARLYKAAEALVDGDELRAAIVNCARTETILGALMTARNEGTSLQTKLRLALVSLIAVKLDEGAT